MDKFIQPRPYADPDAAARKIVVIRLRAKGKQQGFQFDFPHWASLTERRPHMGRITARSSGFYR